MFSSWRLYSWIALTWMSKMAVCVQPLAGQCVDLVRQALLVAALDLPPLPAAIGIFGERLDLPQFVEVFTHVLPI